MTVFEDKLRTRLAAFDQGRPCVSVTVRERDALADAVAVLRDLYDIASVAEDGDPWFTEAAGLDANAVFARADDVLARLDAA